jgi:hypothetical protein
MPKVVIGTYRIVNGQLEDHTRPVEFKGELLARHQQRTSPTSGTRWRLFRTSDNRYIVSVATWRTKPRQETTYTLHEVDEADLQAGGQFEALGRALRSEAMTLEEALDLEAALKEALRIIGGDK